MEPQNKLQTRETNNRLSRPLEPSSVAIKVWIAAELATLSILWDRPLSAERLKAYAEELQTHPQYKLRIALKRLKLEWKSENFGFPLPADIIDRMEPVETLGVQEWQGLTDEQKQEREQFLNSQESKEFVAKLHEAANKVAQKKIQPVREMPPVTERTDAELDRLWHDHQRKVEALKKSSAS